MAKASTQSGSKKLLIVESPAKAKTIGKYLGADFEVLSSVGHVRDLPKENGAIKIEKDGDMKWHFVPTYAISPGKQKVVGELRSAAKSSSAVYLASDPDREGEAIAWHLHEVLKNSAKGKPFYRVSYNEITKNAVLKAIEEPGEIDMPRVDAQQARRILDRLVGYKVSPLLWRNISCANPHSLSAGRVQTVALRLLVERQREIDNFVPQPYFVMGVEARKQKGKESFIAKLARLDGEKPDITDRQTANNLLLDLSDASLAVSDIKLTPKKRNPFPPFTTSTLQQASSSVLGYSPGVTMRLAQSLYEQGLITYMRTDSVNISAQAREGAKAFIESRFGAKFYPETPNFYKSKASAQEAHEAIRPTDISLEPASSSLDAQELKLYDLIWRRFIASQMASAQTTVKTVSLVCEKPVLSHSYVFTASSTEIDFEGFLKVMKLSLKKKDGDDEDDAESDEVARLPPLEVGEKLDAVRWLADEHETKGPPHYSEASLIKALEENGVGRPSTYAATIETLKMRDYAQSDKKKLIPLERGVMVCDWLVKRLDSLFNVGYTAKMEEELDKIEQGGMQMDEMLSQFYAKFTQALIDANPAPEKEKFDTVFALLDEVQEWKPPKKAGGRTYDDKAYVDSVREQMLAGKKPLSNRQLEFLIRIAVSYASQIPDVEMRLKTAGLGAGAALLPQKADEELVKFAFETVDRIGGMMKNPFLKSLREQWERGRGLTLKQFSVLARTVGENASGLEDCAEVRARLEQFVPGGFPEDAADPVVVRLFEIAKLIKEWRPTARKGKKVYDDEGFMKSLCDQYKRRRALSERQVLALKRVVSSYKEQIPDWDELTKDLDLGKDDGDKGES